MPEMLICELDPRVRLVMTTRATKSGWLEMNSACILSQRWVGYGLQRGQESVAG